MKQFIFILSLSIYFFFTCTFWAKNAAYATAGEIQSRAFSGVNRYVPTHARMPVYKIKAMNNRISGDLGKFANALPDNTLDIGAVSNCSVNIGNIMPGNTATGNFGNKETIVLIEGDVVNVSRCQ